MHSLVVDASIMEANIGVESMDQSMLLVPRLDPRSRDCMQQAITGRVSLLHQHAEGMHAIYGIIQLYIEHRSRKFYIHPGERMEFKLRGSISQRMNQATSKIFFRYTSKLIYIVTNFHASDEHHRGPEFAIAIQ